MSYTRRTCMFSDCRFPVTVSPGPLCLPWIVWRSCSSAHAPHTVLTNTAGAKARMAAIETPPQQEGNATTHVSEARIDAVVKQVGKVSE